MCDHGDRRQDAANTELTHKAHREVGARGCGTTGEDGLWQGRLGAAREQAT